jgi:DNA invertase Pin-like site-specific DNA recombinase
VIKLNEIKSVAIYCRVSTEEQASEGYSISAQLQTLRQEVLDTIRKQKEQEALKKYK